MRDMFPGLASGISVLLLVLKVSKHMGRKLPHRYFVDTVHRPLGSRILARDCAFFEGQEFVIPAYESFTKDMQAQWKQLGSAERDVVWDRMISLLDASGRCTE